MAQGTFLQELKEVIYCLVDDNGKFRVMPIGSLGKMKLDKERIDLLIKLIKFIQDTDFLCRETKMYIFNKYITLKGVNEQLNYELGKNKIKLKNTISKIQYDKTKLEKRFGTEFFMDVLSRNKNINKYNTIINQLYAEYGDREWKKKLVIDIPIGEVGESVSDEEFDEFIGMIKPYIVSQVEYIKGELNKNVCGYIYYLMSKQGDLTGIDKERYNRLKLLLGM
ncbi:MAG: hypothetical protein QXD03_03920 [Candidatus Anstonellales archaeon]